MKNYKQFVDDYYGISIFMSERNTLQTSKSDNLEKKKVASKSSLKKKQANPEKNKN